MPSPVRFSQRVALASQVPISTLVTDLMARALAQPEVISLAAGFTDPQTLPVAAARSALEALFTAEEAARAALQYGTTHGYPAFRRMLLDRLLQKDGRLPGEVARAAPEQIVVGAGSNQLLHLIGETLLDPGDIVLTAWPTYFVLLGTLGNLGARAISVATDERGMIPEALHSRLEHLARSGELPRVKMIYVVTYADNPCGITMPADRRAAILTVARRWSREHTIHVVSDAAYRELCYGDPAPPPSLWSFDEEGDAVILADTFSKSFSPGVRIGWALLPPHLVGPVLDLKGNIDFGSPNFNQHLMAKVLELDLYEPHLKTICAQYREKLAAILEAVEAELGPIDGVRWIRPSGGLYLWVELPEQIDAGPRSPLFEAALREGVLYVPGELCYPPEGEPVRRNVLRLSFGVQSEENLRRGVAALGRAIRQVAAASR